MLKVAALFVRLFVKVIFYVYWLILWQNVLYFYLGRSKFGLMYQEVLCSATSSGIIKDMKIDPRNKWRKAGSLKLDTSIYWELMRSSTQARFIKNYDFKNLRFEIQPTITWIIRVSFSTTLDHIKGLFWSHQSYKDSIRELIHYMNNYCVCASWDFVTKSFLIFNVIWSKKLCS